MTETVSAKPFCYVRETPGHFDIQNGGEPPSTDFSPDPKPGYEPLYAATALASSEAKIAALTEALNRPAEIEFNINDDVWVKLTPEGLDIMKRTHDALWDLIGKPHEFRPPAVDEDGYSRFQFWSLMEALGAEFHLGAVGPFGATMRMDITSALARARSLEKQYG